MHPFPLAGHAYPSTSRRPPAQQQNVPMFLFTGPIATKIGEIVHGVLLREPMEEQNHPSRLSGIMVPPRILWMLNI